MESGLTGKRGGFVEAVEQIGESACAQLEREAVRRWGGEPVRIDRGDVSWLRWVRPRMSRRVVDSYLWSRLLDAMIYPPPV